MRLKHKSTGVELEVFLPRVYLEVYGGQPFYKTKGGSFIAHGDYDWELVKEEEWEDVTAECDFNSQFGLGVRVMDGDNCRLRKIDGPHNGPCFIVERKKA